MAAARDDVQLVIFLPDGHRVVAPADECRRRRFGPRRRHPGGGAAAEVRGGGGGRRSASSTTAGATGSSRRSSAAASRPTSCAAASASRCRGRTGSGTPSMASHPWSPMARRRPGMPVSIDGTTSIPTAALRRSARSSRRRRWARSPGATEDTTTSGSHASGVAPTARACATVGQRSDRNAVSTAVACSSARSRATSRGRDRLDPGQALEDGLEPDRDDPRLIAPRRSGQGHHERPQQADHLVGSTVDRDDTARLEVDQQLGAVLGRAHRHERGRRGGRGSGNHAELVGRGRGRPPGAVDLDEPGRRSCWLIERQQDPVAARLRPGEPGQAGGARVGRDGPQRRRREAAPPRCRRPIAAAVHRDVRARWAAARPDPPPGGAAGHAGDARAGAARRRGRSRHRPGPPARASGRPRRWSPPPAGWESPQACRRRTPGRANRRPDPSVRRRRATVRPRHRAQV